MVKFLLRLVLHVLPYSSIRRLNHWRDKVYTLWLEPEFQEFGTGAHIEYPLDLRGGKWIRIGNRSGIGKRGVLTAWDSYLGQQFFPKIEIGDDVWIGEDSHITAIHEITIGNHAFIGKKVTISDNSHGKITPEELTTPPSLRPMHSKGAVRIGHGVWIGDKVTILGGVTIGANSIIGANSFVARDVPENSVVGGVPAKIIRILRPEPITKTEENARSIPTTDDLAATQKTSKGPI